MAQRQRLSNLIQAGELHAHILEAQSGQVEARAHAHPAQTLHRVLTHRACCRTALLVHCLHTDRRLTTSGPTSLKLVIVKQPPTSAALWPLRSCGLLPSIIAYLPLKQNI